MTISVFSNLTFLFANAMPGTDSSKLDPYQFDLSKIKEPPANFLESLKYLGPGFILSASIVGSGELIATTIMGAKAGFVLLWFIIFSCVIKVTLQLEFGKHAISSGETTMASLNSLPGPRMGRANWSIWLWLVLMIVKTVQLGGIIGGVVLAIEQLVPALATTNLIHADALGGGLGSGLGNGLGIPLTIPLRYLVTLLVGFSVSLLVWRGYYVLLERASLIMIGLFTVLTAVSLFMLQNTGLAITGGELASGLTPSWPAAGLWLIVIGAFGITGVGGDEIMAYNYWLIEKGYASFVGPQDESEQWHRRAKGWIRVMYWDAILAMVCYTLMTTMFYLLGAAVLHRNGVVPANNELIATLGSMYTETLGAWAKTAFLIGAVVVLYSTMFAALAAWTRQFSDAFGEIGLIDYHNKRSRLFSIGVLAWLFPICWTLLFLFFESPGVLVIIGGAVTVAILLIVVFAALFFRYRRLDARLRPTRVYDTALWISSAAILLVVLFWAYDLLN